MQSITTPTILAALVALQLAGCASAPDGEKSRTGQGAAIGAVVGGLLGAATGGDRKAILTGAVVGAAVGAAIGNYQDRQVASRAEAARRVALANEPKLEIDGHGNQPQRVKPGAAVESQVGYTVLAPGHAQDMLVTESRVLVRGGETFPLGKREVTRPQGSHVSTLRFTLPADLPKGDYQLVTTIASGTLTRTVQTPLGVG
jgi:Glycine zipper